MPRNVREDHDRYVPRFGAGSAKRKQHRAASAAAHETGWPPNVVMCPNSGWKVRVFIFSDEAANAPSGMPPPMAFAITRMSGIIP